MAKEKIAAKSKWKGGRRGYRGPEPAVDSSGAGAAVGVAHGDDAFQGAILDPDIEAAVNDIIDGNHVHPGYSSIDSNAAKIFRSASAMHKGKMAKVSLKKRRKKKGERVMSTFHAHAHAHAWK